VSLELCAAKKVLLNPTQIFEAKILSNGTIEFIKVAKILNGSSIYGGKDSCQVKWEPLFYILDKDF